MRHSTTTAFSFAALALAACSGEPAMPRLAAISLVGGDTRSFSYSDDRMTAVTFTKADGSLDAEATLQYDDDGQLTLLRSVSPGSPAYLTTLAYKDGRLDSATSSVEGSSSAPRTTMFTYDDEDRVAHIASTNGGDHTSTEDYTYDEDGRLTRLLDTDKLGDVGSTDNFEYQYDGDGLLKSIRKVGTDDIWLFSYDEDQRLTKIVAGSRTYTVEYADGLVSRVIRQDGADARIYAYSYAEGDMEGLVPVLHTGERDYGWLFDLEGRLVPAGKHLLTTRVLVD